MRLISILIVTLVCAPAAAFADWFDSNWTHRQRVTISATVAAADLTDFPYLVSISDVSNPIFARAQASGDDIVFTAGDGSTQRDHEIEHYDAAAGELVAWVKLPLLSSSVDTDLFVYYGNGAVASQENVSGVWSNGYEAVWHLHDDFDDSIGGHDGINANSIDALGLIGDGQDFDPADGLDSIAVGTWNPAGPELAIQAWVYPDGSFLINDPRVIAKAVTSEPQDHVYMMSLTNGTVNQNRLRFRLKTGTDDATGTTTFFGSSPNGYLPAADTWYHVAMTYDGSTMRIIRDGLNGGSTSKSGAVRQNAWRVLIGNVQVDGTAAFGNWEGLIDEVRVSSNARSLDWFRTEYLNQGTPAAYQTLGPEEVEMVLVKRAYDWGGNSIANPGTVHSGALVKFLIYVNNPGPLYTDLSIVDVLDPGFFYVPGTMRVDNSLAACAAPACTPLEEDAIFAAVDAVAASTDLVDGDVASYEGGAATLHLGDGTHPNARLDVAANSVLALSFVVRAN